MLAVSPGYLDALGSSHEIDVRADVRKGGRRLFTGLAVTGGSITVDASSITRRTCTLTIAPRLRSGTYSDVPALPGAPGDVLSNHGQELVISHGLVYPSGITEWVPVGVFRIDEAAGSLLSRTGVTVQGVSREAWVADDRLESPRTISGPSAVALIMTLIRDTLPSAEIVIATTQDRAVWPTIIEEDRWGAIATLATSIGAQVYADPWGRFVIANLPVLGTPSAWQVSTGPGGVLLDAAGASTRAQIYNAVVVRGATPDGAPAPVQAAARDTRPESPTRYGDPDAGAWGKKPRFFAIPSLSTELQCQVVANTQLMSVTGAAEQLDLSAVPNAALEALDVLTIITDHTYPSAPGAIRRHITDSFTLPLEAGARFPVKTRDLGGTT